MAAVRTTKGTLLRNTPPGAPQDAPPLTHEEAKAIAAEANHKAEELGIEARYSVTED